MKRYTIIQRPDYLSKSIAEKMQEAFKDIMVYDEENPELIITVGGDGTVLYALHRYISILDQVAFIGFHTGTLGFLTDYTTEELNDFIAGILSGEFTTYTRNLLEIKTGDHQFLALNEARIENNIKSLTLDVYINDEYLETFRGTGICISTASGSTAYNKTLGGSVVISDAGIMQLTEVQGISNNAYRSLGSPIILDHTQTIKIVPKTSVNSIIAYDSKTYANNDSEVTIKIADQAATFIRIKNVSWIDRLRKSFI